MVFFYDNVYYYDLCNIGPYRKDGKWSQITWHWKLTNDDRTLNIYETYSSTTGIGPFGDKKTVDWKILKLRKNKIWMKTTYNNKEYFIELGPLKTD